MKEQEHKLGLSGQDVSSVPSGWRGHAIVVLQGS